METLHRRLTVLRARRQAVEEAIAVLLHLAETPGGLDRVILAKRPHEMRLINP
jgi:hypothetical protein